uniref:Uncharacterized protein n=1 Tax=Arundo donax TaxID=35708 RepID=A0A0A9C0M2_ARUDO
MGTLSVCYCITERSVY